MNVVFAAAMAVLTTGPAVSAPNPVVECRAMYEAEPARHIACLEQAVQSAARAVESADQVREPDSLGAEQVRTRHASGERARVRIVAASYGAHELGTFRLDNGQIWQETEKTPRHQRLAEGREYEAYIESGKLGGYRMYVDGVRRMHKIRRIE